jgi:SAM-dependent methyltransferase
MHDTSMEYGRLFFNTNTNGAPGIKLADIGAQNVNGSLRSVALPGAQYIGVDFVAGNGVDVIITDPYSLPFEDNSLDVCVSSSCFEHSEFFWLVFNEIMRILKPSGLLYLNVPSNGVFHRYPVDCWRFYFDSGVACKTGRAEAATTR